MKKRVAWSAKRVRAEILARHRAGRPIAASRVEVRLAEAGRRYFGSWAAALEACGLELDDVTLRRPTLRTDEELLAFLRRLRDQQPDLTLSELWENGLAPTLRKRFGSLQEAAARAGIDGWPRASQRVWTPEAILAALRDLHERGIPPTKDMALYAAAKRKFGSLDTARFAAKIPHVRRRTWTREKVAAELRKLARQHGRVTTKHAQAAGCYAAVMKFYGGLGRACSEIGLPCHDLQLSRAQEAQETRTTVLARLREVAATLNRPVMLRDLPYGLGQALLRHFATLAEARRAARLPDPEPWRTWSRERVLEELRHEHRRGTRLTQRFLAEAGRSDLVAAIREYVGRIESARRLAGVPEPPALPRRSSFIKEWDAERVLGEIRERARFGLPLASSKAPRPLVGAAIRYLDSWRGAIEAAGLDYDEIRLIREWTVDALVDELRALALREPTLLLSDLRHSALGEALIRRFGSIEIAVRRADLSGWPQRVAFKRKPVEMVRGELARRATRGKSIRREDVAREQPRLAYAVERLHPSWRKALEMVDLTPPPPTRRGR